MKQLLKELVETPGVSGKEEKVRELISEKIEDEADSIETDNFGNLIARKGSGDKTLMIDAHMDQIGMGVRRITEDGFIRISKIGGAYPISLVNQRVIVHTSEGENLTGVIGAKPSHLVDGPGEGDLPQMEKAFVDVGAEDREDLKDRGVRVGDYITFDRDFKEMINGYVTGPAMDNRIGCAMAIKAFNDFDEDYELVAVFSAQEEVGRKGAKISSRNINPDAAIVLETARAGDTPNMDLDESDEFTGDGFGITMIEASGRGVITPEKVRNWLIENAEDDFNYHRKLYNKGVTNAGHINTSNSGIPTGVVVIPTRHLHTAIEVLKMSDAEEAVEFLDKTFSNFEEYF
ncbi:M42 family metallopeptidase [Candidatus Nanohalobium constans]|uniref:Glutamyl aminopeptidase PepA n=1 Tax=Candidatus Nanohalobium constans TaxID=2565781 RepID=A0A5Q0UEM7_9ARCH|nr:M42 family metallopeptidase [Candidatus Nanohalobium constans]QGA79944.1 glutamyl aminopeptidase PepA [Candidatus Nanohalobium constans]